MKITLKRTGGFTGIPFSTAVDTDQCEEEERNTLSMLVEAAQFFSLPEKISPAAAGPDRFQYQITVERPGERHTVEAGESGIPDSLQPLVRHLMARGRGRQK
jgi:hypothetical protein